MKEVSGYYPHAFTGAPERAITVGNSLEVFNHIPEIKFALPDAGHYFRVPDEFPEPLPHTH